MSKMTLRLWIVVVTVLAGLASPSYAQKITSFDVPGSLSTSALAINSDGQIAGNYQDASSVTHGFLRQQNGTITSFDPPGSSNTFPLAACGGIRFFGVAEPVSEIAMISPPTESC